MPGFMLHLAEGQIILDKLNRIIVSDKSEHLKEDCRSARLKADFIHDFMCGCMIPDATSDKELTHFRPVWQKELITKYPDMDYIMNTYANIISTPCDLGILAHLHLDSLYVSSYWKQLFIFEDLYGNETTAHKNIHHVRLLKDNSHIPYDEFFSGKYFYGDYDRLNPYIYHAIHPYIPDVYVIPPEQIHIKECKNYDADFLADCIQDYVLSDINISDYEIIEKFPIPETRIFPYSSILDFLNNTAAEYIQLIKEHNLFK